LNYFGFFLDDIHPNSSRYLNLNMILFTSLISGGTLMVKESFVKHMVMTGMNGIIKNK
jgi:hypothetical protein